MTDKLFSQLKARYIFVALLLLLSLGFTACGGAATHETVEYAPEEAAAEETVVEKEVEVAQEVSVEVEAEGETNAAPDNNIGRVSSAPIGSRRLIIKNAEVEMLVENTDTAINRSLGLVTEFGGYVVSNRTWFKQEFKYATLTIGVPVQNFEEMLRRLKDLAVKVTNETASGQDVTDQFVDLESRLRNLETTATRIRNFMDQAKDVEQALEISVQLSQIEAEIEQVKGQMVYLSDRAAFSTITLQISPQMPKPAPAPSPTPTPTPTPEPWSVTGTFNNATGVSSNIARSLFQVGVELLIWVVVVILPFTLPLLGLIWLVVWLARRMGVGQTPPPPSA